MTRAFCAMPAMPMPLFDRAAMTPATCVPCELSSVPPGYPPLTQAGEMEERKLAPAMTAPARSACVASTPVSMTATVTGVSVGGTRSSARSRKIFFAPHWPRPTYGSVFQKGSVGAESRCTRASASTSVTPVEADARVHLDSAPTDPFWNTDPYVGLGQWGAKKIFLDRALDLVPPTLTPVTVAVIDTGVDATHADLAGAVIAGASFLSSISPACEMEERK